MSRPAFLPLLLLALLSASPLAAQAVREGSVVRVHRERAPVHTGRVEGLSSDTLWLRGDGSLRPIPLTSIHRLELGQPEPRAGSGWRWAKRGLLAGALLGGITCLADQDECASGMGPADGLTEGLLAASMFTGGGLGLLGFVGGAAFPGTVWVQVPFPGSR